MINNQLIIIFVFVAGGALFYAYKKGLFPKIFNFIKTKKKEILSVLKNVSVKEGKIKYILALSAIIVAGYIIASFATTRAKCKPLSPSALGKYETVTGQNPLLGEKCSLGKESFLLLLKFDNTTQVRTAQIALMGATNGTQSVIKSYPRITSGSGSVIFIEKDITLGILVLPNVVKDASVEKMIDKALNLNWESDNLTLASDTSDIEIKTIPNMSSATEKNVQQPAQTPTTPTRKPRDTKYGGYDSEEEQLLATAKDYVEENSVAGLEFDLEISKKLNKWVLLYATPTNMELDSVGVVMEKVNDIWIARVMGTYFEEYSDKVPELFDFN